MRTVYITTTDNPYNPATEFDKWYAFDVSKGYNTCGYLARIAKTSNGYSDSRNDAIIEQAIDEILEYNLTGRYKKVVIDRPDTTPAS